MAVAAVCLAAAMLAGVSAQGGRAGAFGVGQADGRGGGGQRAGGRGQGPARDLPGQLTTGTGLIAGTVTLSDSGTPVRRAQVMLSDGGRGGRSAATDEEGRFSFIGLPAGRFTLTVSKPGFATMSYGAKKPGRQGTPIQLMDGQAMTNVSIALPKGGVITGVVVDEFNEPAPNTVVRAYRYTMQNGERTLRASGQSQTDDRGMYRIFQLLPGDYLVSAVPRNNAVANVSSQIQLQLQPLLDQLQGPGGAAGFVGVGAAVLASGRGQQVFDQIQALQQQLGDQPEQSTAYAPVYYPGTTSPAQAARITLDAAQERTGVDFQLQVVPTARVQGRVTGPETTMAPGAQVVLQSVEQQDVANVPGLGRSMTRLGPDGAFSFQGVTPGDYRLTVRVPVPAVDAAQEAPAAAASPGRGRGFGGRGGRGGPIAQVLWASTDLSVNGRDISDLALALQPGMTISGRIAFDAASTQPPSDLSSVRVTILPTDGDGFGGPMLDTADANGAFSIRGVVPGRYLLRANLGGFALRGSGAATFGQPAVANAGAWTLESATVNGRDALDFGLDIQPNQSLSGMVLTFTDRAQQISGTLQDAMGRPTPDYTIVLFPADTQFWVPQSRRILSTRPGTDGAFTFRGFPAGQYRLTAVVDAEPGEWFDPAFLTQVLPASVAVTVADGEAKVQDLRLATR